MSQSATIDLKLHKKQAFAFNSKATEILYGGAAGGGKSHLMRVAAVIWCSSIPGLQVYLFRRIEGDLKKNHIEGPNGFREMLSPWINSGLVKILDDEIRFWNGAKIWLCHCKDEKHRYKYLGAEIHVLLVDELTTFTENIYRFLRSRVRAPGLKLPAKYAGMFPRILCSSNPGNVGHLWVKTSFVDLCRDGSIQQMPDEEGGMLRQYIPAKLDDNPSMAANDPDYVKKLRGLGSAALVKAMEDGDWDVIEGAFFDCWDGSIHELEPFKIPNEWRIFRSGDWGSAKPFSIGWWAIVSDWFQTPDGFWLPRGALVRYREWYGTKPGKPNTGLKLTAGDVGRGIKERDGAEHIDPSYLDPAAFAEDGGPSLAERINNQLSKGLFIPADNKRVAARGAMGGWDQMRDRLKGEDFGEPYGERPMIYCFKTCYDSIRTIPALQHDEDRPEDLDTDGEDHAADDWRYACMSRPWVRPLDIKDKEPKNDGYGWDEEEEDNWQTA